MAQAAKEPSVTSQTIAVEHVRISSERPFAEVRSKLEGTVPKLDIGIAEALRSGDQERAKDYEVFCAMLPSDGGEGASEIGCPQGN
jgi:hypothetical protein